MSNYLKTFKKETKPYLKTLYDDHLAKRDLDFFRPTGTQIYVGSQGSGKTISAVYHLTKLKRRYPKSVIVSNLQLTKFIPTEINEQSLKQGLPLEESYWYFETMEQLALALVAINNGKFGVIYLIDEIHTYFNALDSKNIPMYVFTEISQQRKQRKLIIGTSQLFLRAAKPLREQCDNVIVCTTYLGVFTLQRAYDGMTLDQDYNGKLSGKHLRTGWFIQRREIRESYDTYQKVVSGMEQYETNKPIEIQLNAKNRKTFRHSK